MVPSQFVVVDDLPLRPNGKIDRSALPALPDRADRPDHAVREPRSDREARLSAIWRRVIGVDSVSIDDNFFELGGHSLMAVRLIAEIEKEFGVKLPLSSLLLEGGTIEAQSNLLVDGSGRSAWTPVVPIQPNGARPPLFLVHGIGGEVLSFTALARHLGPDQPVFGLQANTDEGAGFFSSVEQVALRYIAAIRELVPSGAFRLGGYSSGGIIAYEMAQQLRAAGDEVSELVLLDCAAPVGIRNLHLGWRPKDSLHGLMYWLADDDFLASSSKEQLERLRSKLRLWRARAAVAIGRKPVTIDVRDRLGLWQYPVNSQEGLEAHIRMVRAYRPQRYPGSVTLLRARTMNLGLLGAPKDLGWHLLADGVRVEVVPGAHDTIMREPRVRTLAAKLEATFVESVVNSPSSRV
jgi:thioesterase domain-containing protein/acyl carrier protein